MPAPVRSLDFCRPGSYGGRAGPRRGILRVMMSSSAERRLRVLHLEDSVLDHELTYAQLRRGGLNVAMQRIDSEPEFLRALE